jgi:K+/H+ antiporter YhaU regulatory subunit KhtT
LLDIEKSIEKLDKDLVKKYKAKLVDKKEIEISISRKQNITDLISDLSKMDIIVTSFRNKRSRLEQLFINITKE